MPKLEYTELNRPRVLSLTDYAPYFALRPNEVVVILVRESFEMNDQKHSGPAALFSHLTSSSVLTKELISILNDDLTVSGKYPASRLRIYSTDLNNDITQRIVSFFENDGKMMLKKVHSDDLVPQLVEEGKYFSVEFTDDFMITKHDVRKLVRKENLSKDAATPVARHSAGGFWPSLLKPLGFLKPTVAPEDVIHANRSDGP